jgi:hypothetical protein
LDEYSWKIQDRCKVPTRYFALVFGILPSSKAATPAANRTEDNMLKYLSIFAALLALGSNPAQAQQQEAVLHQVEIPEAGFDVIVARPSSSRAIINLGSSPEALVIHLIGGELALSFDSEDRMLKALGSLQLPACAFQVERAGGTSREPVAVYVVPKSQPVASTRQ